MKKDKVELDSDMKFVARIDPKLKAYYEANSLSGRSLDMMALDVAVSRRKVASLEHLSAFASLIGVVSLILWAILSVVVMFYTNDISLALVSSLLLLVAAIALLIIGDAAGRKVRKIRIAKRAMMETLNELRDYVSLYGFISAEADLTEQKGLMFDEGFMRRSVENMAYSVIICEGRIEKAIASFYMSPDKIEGIHQMTGELMSLWDELDKALTDCGKFGLEFERGEIFAAARRLMTG